MFSALFDALQTPSLAREVSPPSPSGPSFYQQFSASSTPASARQPSTPASDNSASDSDKAARRGDDRTSARVEDSSVKSQTPSANAAAEENDSASDEASTDDAPVVAAAETTQPIRDPHAINAEAESAEVESISSVDGKAADKTAVRQAARKTQARGSAAIAAETLNQPSSKTEDPVAAQEVAAKSKAADATTITAEAEVAAGQLAATNEGSKNTSAANGSAKRSASEADAAGSQRAASLLVDAEGSTAATETRTPRVAKHHSRHEDSGAPEPKLEGAPSIENDAPRASDANPAPDAGTARGPAPASSDRNALGSSRSVHPETLPPGLNDLERTRLVQRVAKAFQHVDSEGGSVRIRLSPPELGSLRIELSVHGGVMAARLEAENPVTRSLLLENLPALRERLAEQQIRVERFDVDLSQRDHGQNGQAWADQQHSAPWERTTGRGARRGTSSARGEEAATAPRQRLTPGRFNVLV